VASCLLAFIEAADVSGGHLVAWSDSWCGQNKNFYVLCLWQHLIRNGRFSIIDHKFPESGHSYMDSDRDFAFIEKGVRRVENVYSVDQYQDIMAQSQVKSKPQITRMKGNLYDIKMLPAALGLAQCNKTTDGEKVRFRDNVRWIRIMSFGSYMFRESFNDDETWKTVCLMQQKSSCAATVVSIPECCHKIDGDVKSAKLQDLKKQLQYIPKVYQPFYLELLAAGNKDENDNDATSGDTAKNRFVKLARFCIVMNYFCYLHTCNWLVDVL